MRRRIVIKFVIILLLFWKQTYKPLQTLLLHKLEPLQQKYI